MKPFQSKYSNFSMAVSRLTPGSSFGAATAPLGATRAILDRADQIDPEPIAWVCPGYLAIAKLHLLAGSPGTGKSGIVDFGIRPVKLPNDKLRWPADSVESLIALAKSIEGGLQ